MDSKAYLKSKAVHYAWRFILLCLQPLPEAQKFSGVQLTPVIPMVEPFRSPSVQIHEDIYRVVAAITTEEVLQWYLARN